jgi:acyl-CoA reductase-like NAD-dependent aldehyde dehydrogenase
MSAVAPLKGSAKIPQAQGTLPASTEAELDEAVTTVGARKDAWTQLDIPARIALLRQLIDTTLGVADAWVDAALRAKGIPPGTPIAGEEWLAGPLTMVRNLRLLIASLEDVHKVGVPRLPGKPRALPSGQVVAPVFPTGLFDKLLFAGFEAEVWMEPGVTLDSLSDTQAVVYQAKREGRGPAGKVALVLGAGNVSSIGPMDALYKFFVEDQVVILKMNPVNEYLGPFFERALKALVDGGFLRIVYGGAKEGAYLCQHAGIDEIHITGSDKTHDAIVYGVGDEGAKNKAADKRLITKRITSELGNVSPVIVVPGPWGDGDIDFQSQNLASMLTNNAGFNCNATRIIVQHASWSRREALLEAVRGTLTQVPTRKAYYPGAESRHQAFCDAHANAELLGKAPKGHLPWTLIPDLDASNPDDICFTTEAFCGVFGEMTIEADSVAEYIDKAVAFCNDEAWGTLNAAIIVHPASLKDPDVKDAVDRAIADLKFGSVAVNHWPALAYGFVSSTWGAFPGHTFQDIQSGIGVVHNTYLFDKPQKTVVRGPFRVTPKPPWFVTNKRTHEIAPKITRFEGAPSWLKIPSILWSALRG